MVNRRSRPQLESLEAKQLLTTFVVTSTADSGPGTLRQAILDANADAQPSGSDTAEQINFDLPGSGVQTIAPLTPLPGIDQPTTIDATTQPGYAGSPLVALDGVHAVDSTGNGVAGLQIDSKSLASTPSTIAGLEIIRFSGPGIWTQIPFTAIHNDIIGTDAAGDDLGNGGYGILFTGGYTKTVGDSVIEYNGLEAFGINIPTGSGGVLDSSGFVTQNVVDEHNDTQGTHLLVSETLPPPNAYTNPSVSPPWDSDVTLTYVVTNTGVHPATNVTVDLSQNWLYRMLSDIRGTTSQGTIHTGSFDSNAQISGFADLGTIAPGTSVVLTVTAHVGSKADFAGKFGELTVVANSPQLDYTTPVAAGSYNINPTDTAAAPVTGPSLAITTPAGTYDDHYVAYGSVQPLIYTVTNTGTTDATNVAVSFGEGVVPLLVSMISATTTQGTLNPNFDIGSNSDSNVASIGTLAPGASATITILAQVPAQSANDSEIINAVVTSDQNPATTPPNNALYTLTATDTGQEPAPVTPVTPVTPITTTNPGGPAEPVTFIPVNDPVATPIVVGTGTSTGTTTTSTGTTVVGINPGGPEIPPTPADLVVSGTAPDSTHAGSPGLFLMTVRNAGGTTATDAVAALNLAALPTGSFYSILTRTSTGADAAVTPLIGHPGVYLVDLGPLDAGASAVVDVLVIPTTGGPMSLALAASDATAPTADPSPANNVAYLGSAIATPTPVVAATMAAPAVVQVTTSASVTKAEAENLAHYQLTTTTTGSASGQATMVKLRSASYNAAKHEVTLRLAHPIPVTASTATLVVSGLGASGTTSLALARYRSQG